MHRFHRALMMVIILVIISSLEIELAEGIKCYQCDNCTAKGGNELNCDRRSDRCLESIVIITKTQQILHIRQCSSEETQKESAEQNYTCDAFRQFNDLEHTFVKECFCSTDLCNDELLSKECKQPTEPANGGPMIGEYFCGSIASLTAAFFLLQALFQ